MNPVTRSRQPPHLAMLFALLLGIASLPAMAARTVQDTQRNVSARDQMDAFCEEEKLHAEPWIRWAAANRAACRRQATNPSEELNCLSAVRQQLLDMEREHAAVYLGQMKSLRPDHPVMQTILKRLRSNRDMAATAIDEDVEPIQLAALRKQLCISSFPR
jgi:hypothetical protein